MLLTLSKSTSNQTPSHIKVQQLTSMMKIYHRYHHHDRHNHHRPWGELIFVTWVDVNLLLHDMHASTDSSLYKLALNVSILSLHVLRQLLLTDLFCLISQDQTLRLFSFHARHSLE